MKKITDRVLLNHYIEKYGLDKIFSQAILERARLLSYKKGEFIFEAGSKLEYFGLLADGKVKVSYLFENGKSMFLKFYEGFHILGDLEFLKDIPVLCNVEVIKDCRVIAIPADLLRREYHDNAVFLRYLAESLSDKLYATINNSSYNYIYPLINRLASYITELAADQDVVVLNSSYEEIAQFLGATYRHLNRTIKEMESKSILQVEDKKINILDRKELQALSKNIYI